MIPAQVLLAKFLTNQSKSLIKSVKNNLFCELDGQKQIAQVLL